MTRYFYVDESGFGEDWVFTAVSINDPSIANKIIKNWRSWMKNRRNKPFHQNEYHDTDADNAQRKKILIEISKHKGNLEFWSVLKNGYNGNHRKLYVPTIVELLNYCGITEKDTIIAVDRVETKKAHMERHLRKIKSSLGMPGLEIYFKESEREKGIQVADAIAGATCRESIDERPGPSYFDIILNQMANDLKRL